MVIKVTFYNFSAVICTFSLFLGSCPIFFFFCVCCTNSILSSGQGMIFLAVFGLDKAGLVLAIGQKLLGRLGLPSFADVSNNFVLKSDNKSEDFTKPTREDPFQMKS